MTYGRRNPPKRLQVVLSVCAVDAIYAGNDLLEGECAFDRSNAEFFGCAVSGWGSPGGDDSAYVSNLVGSAFSAAFFGVISSLEGCFLKWNVAETR